MSEISSASLGSQVQNSVLALKLQLQQEAAVLSLVQQAVDSSREAAASPPASDKLVDIIV